MSATSSIEWTSATWMCGRCGSSMDHDYCELCGGDGYFEEDDGELGTAMIDCGQCGGKGGWWRCMSGYEWCEGHPRPGKEGVAGSTPEWFGIPERAS